jgi:PPOX class probable F420-dependent enzyme
MLEIDDSLFRFISERRVARLATADDGGQPSVVPICYTFDGRVIYTPIDEKPKSVAEASLRRVRNIGLNPRVAVVIDDYSEDWSRLAYVLISGVAGIIEPDAPGHSRAVESLRSKYEQYRSMRIDERLVIEITPVRIKHWGAVGS